AAGRRGLRRAAAALPAHGVLVVTTDQGSGVRNQESEDVRQWFLTPDSCPPEGRRMTETVVECPRCRSGRETFWYRFGGRYEFDVDKARALAGDGREPVEVEEESVRVEVESSELDECHVPPVDASIPGLIAHVWYPARPGEEWHGHLLIDGHHRAARCLREGRTFRAYLLSEEESRAVLLCSPSGPEEVGE